MKMTNLSKAAAAEDDGIASGSSVSRKLALLFAAIADNAAPITLAEGGFERLERAYDALGRMIGAGRADRN